MPQGLGQGETLEPLRMPPPGMPMGSSHPALNDGEELEPIRKQANGTSGTGLQGPTDTGFVHGVMRGARNILSTAKNSAQDIANPDMPVALSDRPQDQGSIGSRLQGNTMVNKYLLAPAAQEKQRSLEEAAAMRGTHGLESLGHGLTSMIHTAGEFVPVVGPMVGSLVDRARGGDVSGAVGEGLTYAVAPKVARGVGGRLIEGARDLPGVRTMIPSVEGVGRSIGQSRIGSGIERAFDRYSQLEAPPRVIAAPTPTPSPRGLLAGRVAAPPMTPPGAFVGDNPATYAGRGVPRVAPPEPMVMRPQPVPPGPVREIPPIERRGIDPELQGWYRGPERRIGQPVAPEDQGFNWAGPEDLGNKVRPELKQRWGPSSAAESLRLPSLLPKRWLRPSRPRESRHRSQKIQRLGA